MNLRMLQRARSVAQRLTYGTLSAPKAAPSYGFFACGSNEHGRLALGDETARDVLCRIGSPVHGEYITQVALTPVHTLLLLSNGDVYACGSNISSQLGVESDKTITPTLVAALAKEKIVHVCASSEASFAVTDDGRVYSWGTGILVGAEPDTARPEPRRLLLPEGVRINRVLCNDYLAVFEDTERKYYAVGSGEIGVGYRTTTSRPIQMDVFDSYDESFAFAVGHSHAGVVSTIDGEVEILTFGNSTCGQLGHGGGAAFELTSSSSSPMPVVFNMMSSMQDEDLAPETFSTLALGFENGALLNDGRVVHWGSRKAKHGSAVDLFHGLDQDELRFTALALDKNIYLVADRQALLRSTGDGKASLLATTVPMDDLSTELQNLIVDYEVDTSNAQLMSTLQEITDVIAINGDYMIVGRHTDEFLAE